MWLCNFRLWLQTHKEIEIYKDLCPRCLSTLCQKSLLWRCFFHREVLVEMTASIYSDWFLQHSFPVWPHSRVVNMFICTWSSPLNCANLLNFPLLSLPVTNRAHQCYISASSLFSCFDPHSYWKIQTSLRTTQIFYSSVLKPESSHTIALKCRTTDQSLLLYVDSVLSEI